MSEIETGTVFIVDDDEAVRDSLCLLMEAESLPAKSYASAIDFLEQCPDDQPGCLLLDIRMPKMSGLELRDEMLQRGTILPVIFITGHGDVSMAVDAMKHGAVDFLQKPFDDEELLDRVRQALARNHAERNVAETLREVSERHATLTPRELEVMEFVVAGNANKVIAMDLNVSQRTVEIHRARVMEKMRARSIAHLVRLAAILDK